MTFHSFSLHLHKLEQTASRLEMTELLSALFKELSVTEVVPACYLMQGSLVPAYQSKEFQLSTKMVLRALAHVAATAEPTASVQNLFGESNDDAAVATVTKRYKELGDVGDVAEELMSAQAATKTQLDFQNVFDQLVEIADEGGMGSQDRKLALVEKLLRQLSPLAARYVVRIIIGNLRLGFSTMTILDALSWTVTGSKEDSKFLELAYQKKADVGKLAQAYLQLEPNASSEKRQAVLNQYQVEVGVPIVPALCQRLNSAVEIIEKLSEVIAEPKYDGLRVQLHIDARGDKPKVSIFTRNLGTVTEMFPELQALASQFKAKQLILDGEAIGYDTRTGKLKPFQETISRKRKHDVAERAVSVPIRMYVYDVLAIDGTSYLDKPLQERKDALKKLFKENEVLKHTPYIVTSDPNELRTFHQQQLAEGLEGAVVKAVSSTYQSGRKGWHWVKIKEAEGTSGKLNDTLDLLVMGYYKGKGKRAEFEIGSLLMGVRAERETFLTICKLGSGLSEENSAVLLKKIKSLRTNSAPPMYEVPKNLEPDVWIQPGVVVEVAADELTTSPMHSAGKALRFPRLLAIREDKNWSDATSVDELSKIMVSA